MLTYGLLEPLFLSGFGVLVYGFFKNGMSENYEWRCRLCENFFGRTEIRGLFYGIEDWMTVGRRLVSIFR